MADKNICFTFKRKSQYYHENKKDHQNGTSNYRQNKVRTKATVRRLDDFRVVAREKKENLSIQNKTNINRTKKCKNYKERRSYKKNQRQNKVSIFQWKFCKSILNKYIKILT